VLYLPQCDKRAKAVPKAAGGEPASKLVGE
jgi:hypothetical protein